MTELREVREALGLTQAELAGNINAWCEEKTGKRGTYTFQRVSQFECGVRSLPPMIRWFISDAG